MTRFPRMALMAGISGVILAGCSPTEPLRCPAPPYGSVQGAVIGPTPSGTPRGVAGAQVALVAAQAQPCMDDQAFTTRDGGAFGFFGLVFGETYEVSFVPPPGYKLASNADSVRTIVATANRVDTLIVRLHFTPQDSILTFYVGPQQVDCVGLFPRKCLLVKVRAEDNYTYFYDPISGFAFEPGFEYVLRVNRTRKPDVFMDSGLYDYALVEVVTKTSVSLRAALRERALAPEVE